MPGETRSLTIEATASDLDGEAPMLVVDGWNVTVNAASGSRNPVRVTPNIDALDVGPSAPPLVTGLPNWSAEER